MKHEVWFDGFKIILVATGLLSLLGARGWLYLSRGELRVLWAILIVQLLFTIWVLATNRGS